MAKQVPEQPAVGNKRLKVRASQARVLLNVDSYMVSLSKSGREEYRLVALASAIVGQ